MAAPGTIVLTVADPALKRDHPNHQFSSLGGQFDSSLCLTPVPFTIHPKEGHVLLTDLDRIYGAVLQTPDGRQTPLSTNGLSPLQLCYAVQLKSPDMMLHVGRDTSLSLLLRAGCLKVTPFTVTKAQVAQMFRPPSAGQPAAASGLFTVPCPPPVKPDDNDDDRLVIDI